MSRERDEDHAMSRERDENHEPDGLDEALSAWVDGELSREAEAQLRATLESAPELHARAQKFRAVDEALRGMAAPEVSPEFAARVRRAIEEQSSAAESGANVLPMSGLRRVAPWAAALAAGLAVVFVMSSREGSVPSEMAEVPAATLQPETVDSWSDLADAELEVALELEALEDFEVIEQLEVLELLVAFDDDSAFDENTQGLGS